MAGPLGRVSRLPLAAAAAGAALLVAVVVGAASSPPLADGTCIAGDSCEEEPSALLQTSGRGGLGRDALRAEVTATAASSPGAPALALAPAAAFGAARVWVEEERKGLLDRNTTASELVGIKGNAVGDLYAFGCNVGVNFAIMVASLIAFCFLRHRYPLVYSNNVRLGLVDESRHSDTFFGWIHATLALRPEEVERAAGLDACMLLEFCKMCMQIMAAVGLPLLGVLGPLHLIAGQDHADRLSRLGMGNIVDGRRICWVHAGFVWYVVVVAEYFILRAQHTFIGRRHAWLRAMPAPRRTTVLVERVPPEFRSDAALMQKFKEMFGQDGVEAAMVVKRTEVLTSLLADEESADRALHQAEFQWNKDGKDPDKRPCFRNLFGERKDSIDYYTHLKREASEAIASERKRINDCSGDEEVNSSSGFVTFTSRREQELALMVPITPDADEFLVSVPPDPSDVLYADLLEDPTKRTGRKIFGYACIVGIYVGFMPFIVAISQLTNLENLAKHFHAVRAFTEAYPAAVPLIDSLSAVVALKTFMMFLPTILMLVFRSFFCLRAEAWAQYKLQSSYFWFLAVFEILVTSVGSSLTHTTQALLEHPMSIFVLLADTLPNASHFYLNFIVVNWATHLMNITRYINLMKFLSLRAVVAEEKAREWAEPEDQDWYGFGGRSARFTENMVIGLIYCTISPLITLLTFLDFFFCRLVYGYLLVFAETRKHDLGGHFWVRQLDHLQKGLLIYVFTMVGVVFRIGATRRPALLTAGALLIWAAGYRRLQHLRWESLPLQELGRADERSSKTGKAPSAAYVQPELLGTRAPPTLST